MKWHVVYVVGVGAVAGFQSNDEAVDHANTLRDIIGEARGSLSTISTREMVVTLSEPGKSRLVEVPASGNLPRGVVEEFTSK